MAVPGLSPGSPSSHLYTTFHLSDSEDMGKRRRRRTIIGAEQLAQLEALYKLEQWPNRERKEKLAREMGMSTHFVNIWFQNKRSRMKKMAQEEAELAALRNEQNEGGGVSASETEQQQTSSSDIGTAKSCDSDSQNSVNSMNSGSQQSKASPRPSPRLRPIAPKSPITPTTAAKRKLELPLKQNLSPQVVCVKLPLVVAQSLSSPVAKKMPKLADETGQSSQTSTATEPDGSQTQQGQGLSQSQTLIEPSSAQKTSDNPVPIPDPVSEVVIQTSPAAQQMKVLAQKSHQQQQLQQLVCQQQQAPGHLQNPNCQQQQHIYVGPGQQQQQPCKPAQVRFGTNPTIVLNKLPLSTNASVPAQLIDSSREVPSKANCTPSTSNPAVESTTYQQPSLFDCLVAMAAVEEGGGMVQENDPTYDIAVNSALYGIKIEDENAEMVLTYDQKKGLCFASNEVASDAEI